MRPNLVRHLIASLLITLPFALAGCATAHEQARTDSAPLMQADDGVLPASHTLPPTYWSSKR